MADDKQDGVTQPFHREGDALVFDTPPDPKEVARQRREDEQHSFARSQVKTNRTLAWFTGALVLATFCTIGVGVWQAKISQRASNAAKSAADTAAKTLKEMQSGQGATDTHTLAEQAKTQAIQTTNLANAAKDQASAAKVSADAAKESTNLAKESLHIGEAPVLVANYSYGQPQDWFPNSGTRELTVPVTYKNLGKTPALAVVLTAYLNPDGGLQPFAIPKYDGLSGDVLASGDTSPIKSAFTWNHKWIDTRQFISGNRQYANHGYSVFGVIQYKDIFGDQHTTAFCNYYPYVLLQQNPPRQCETGNWFEHPPTNSKPNKK